MKKIMVACLLCLFWVSLGYTKVIFIGSHGGPVAYSNYWALGETYDPLVAYGVKEDSLISKVYEAAIAHGVDASIAFFRINSSVMIYPLISKDTASVSVGEGYVQQVYKDGDYVFLVGYSAGGKYVINLADTLEKDNIPVHFLGLIDPVIGFNISIPRNVKEAVLYVQKSESFDPQGFPFFFYDGSETNYSAYTVVGPDVNHSSIDNQEIVWTDLGNRMLSVANIDLSVPVVLGDSYVSEDDSEETASDEGNGLPENPGFETINPYTNSTDIHITHCKIRPYKEGSWHKRVDVELGPGGNFNIEMEVRIRNKSNYDLENIDVDYLVVKDKKDFDLDKRYRLEDEDVDIEESKKESKHSGRIKVYISEDFKTITVSSKHSFTFLITEQNIEDGEITLYFHTDIETEDGSDQDISSESKSDEYGKLVIYLLSTTPNFSISQTTGIAPLTINFTDTSLGNISDWNWNFGDGNTTPVINPIHTFGVGTFNTTLTIEDYFGFSRSKAVKIIVVSAPVPSITITNPTSSDKWKSNKDHTIRWTWKNLPRNEAIKIEYTCDGKKHWRTIYRGKTNNDGSKKWKMKKSKTKDTSSGYIRILRRSDNSVLGISPRFKIDHKRKTKKW